MRLGVVVHSFNLSTWKLEAGTAFEANLDYIRSASLYMEFWVSKASK